MIENGPTRGTGMLAMFVDLDDQYQEEFREWLTRDMFTARLNIGFHACASYDRLSDAPVQGAAPQKYVTVYEMNSLGDLYGEPYQGLRRVRDPLDAAFHERFQRPDRYTLSWSGPELTGGAPGFAPVIHVDRFDLAAENAQAFNIWFVTEYLPACEKVPGLVRVRRYLAAEGEPRHVIFHEFESADGLTDADWQAARQDDTWALADMHPGGSAAYTRVVAAP